MNDQEIFDAVVRHLLTQERKSMKQDGVTCAYRGEGGLSCAVGALITDAEYQPVMDDAMALGRIIAKPWGTSVDALDMAGVLPGRLKPHVRLLAYLQDVHDAADLDKDDRFKTEALEESLFEAACEYDLNSEVIIALRREREAVAA